MLSTSVINARACPDLLCAGCVLHAPHCLQRQQKLSRSSPAENLRYKAQRNLDIVERLPKRVICGSFVGQRASVRPARRAAFSVHSALVLSPTGIHPDWIYTSQNWILSLVH